MTCNRHDWQSKHLDCWYCKKEKQLKNPQLQGVAIESGTEEVKMGKFENIGMVVLVVLVAAGMAYAFMQV